MNPEQDLCAELRAYFNEEKADLTSDEARDLYRHVATCETCKQRCLVPIGIREYGSMLQRYDRIPRFVFLTLKRAHRKPDKERVRCNLEGYDFLVTADALARWRQRDWSVFEHLYQELLVEASLLPFMFATYEAMEQYWPEIAARTFVTAFHRPDVVDLNAWMFFTMHEVLDEQFEKRGEQKNLTPYTYRIASKLMNSESWMIIELHYRGDATFGEIAPVIYYKMKPIGARERALRGLVEVKEVIRALTTHDASVAIPHLAPLVTLNEQDPCRRFTRALSLSEESLPNDTIEGWSTHANTCSTCQALLSTIEEEIRSIVQGMAGGKPLGRSRAKSKEAWRRMKGQIQASIERELAAQRR